jgi:hypothetical protein
MKREVNFLPFKTLYAVSNNWLAKQNNNQFMALGLEKAPGFFVELQPTTICVTSY